MIDQPEKSPAGLKLLDERIRNAIALNKIAAARPPNERFHGDYVNYNLEEKMCRLQSLGLINPLILGPGW